MEMDAIVIRNSSLNTLMNGLHEHPSLKDLLVDVLKCGTNCHHDSTVELLKAVSGARAGTAAQAKLRNILADAGAM